MKRTEKRLENLKKQIEETEARIKSDTETLANLKTEYDSLTAMKISEFAKKRNIVIDDKFFEMLSMVCKMDSDSGSNAPEEINIFVPETANEDITSAITENTNSFMTKEDDNDVLF